MADEGPERMARFKLLLPANPAEDDDLRLAVEFLDIRINVKWSHRNQHEVIHLLRNFAEPLLRKCSHDYQQALAATEIDGDLAALFPEDEAE